MMIWSFVFIDCKDKFKVSFGKISLYVYLYIHFLIIRICIQFDSPNLLFILMPETKVREH